MTYQKQTENYNKNERNSSPYRKRREMSYKKLILALGCIGVIFVFILNLNHIESFISSHIEQLKQYAESRTRTTEEKKLSVENDTKHLTPEQKIIAELAPESESNTINNENEADLNKKDTQPKEDNRTKPIVSTIPVEEIKEESPKEELSVKELFYLYETYSDSGLMGIRERKSKKVLISPIFDRIASLTGGNIAVWIPYQNGKSGLIDAKGQLLASIYDRVEHWVEYLTVENSPYFTIEQNNKKGLFSIDKRRMVIPIEYSNKIGRAHV